MADTQVLQNSIDTVKIPTKIRKASAKILTEYGYTVKEIEKLTGISKSGVDRLKRRAKKDIRDVDSATWDLVTQSIKKVLVAKQDKLMAKTLKEMERKVDSGKAPLGTLAFTYKVLAESNKPKESSGINVSGSTLNVQVVRGDVSYSSDSKAISTDNEAK
jgi:hypothetical protein